MKCCSQFNSIVSTLVVQSLNSERVLAATYARVLGYLQPTSLLSGLVPTGDTRPLLPSPYVSYQGSTTFLIAKSRSGYSFSIDSTGGVLPSESRGLLLCRYFLPRLLYGERRNLDGL